VRVVVRVKGGGISSQSEAVRHGISRILVAIDPEFKKKLRGAGFLTRDPRKRERKKFGLKRARRAPQWKKR
ncbi:MAG: 30S ribosomal protein S9, partial [Candidatus Pacebacteria bacterium]|nr:30S ribosomal protein S9 [Candidatus Paceibacterota bacterium]